MNNKQIVSEYLAFCKEIDTDPSKVVISSGAALVLLNCREEAGDLDLDVPLEIYERYKTEANVRRSSLGEYVDYSDVVSLHAKEHELDARSITVLTSVEYGDQIYIYSPARLVEQKTKLLEMEDRIPEKIPQDIRDLDALIECLVFMGGINTAEDHELIRRAGAAKAARI